MANPRKAWSESLGDLLASWGLSPRVATSHGHRAAIKVFGPAPDRAEVFIGFLTNEQGEFVFRYDPEYASRASYPALTAFPDKDREYRSAELWPFFEVRLPPLDRADIQHLIRERNIDAGDTMRLLGELGARTITTPYQLRYEQVAA